MLQKLAVGACALLMASAACGGTGATTPPSQPRRKRRRRRPRHPRPCEPTAGCTVGVSWNNFQQPRWAAHDKPHPEDVEAAGGTYIDKPTPTSAPSSS